jgi:hypothetical protein
VTEVHLTANPHYSAADQSQGQAGAEAGVGQAKWICPLSQREMNGSVRFVYLLHCGSVVSEAALRELRAKRPAGAELAPCSVCSQPYNAGEPELGHVINPGKEETEQLRLAWEARKAADKASKKSKKRKADKGPDEDEAKGGKKQAVDVATNQHTAAAGAPRLPTEIAAALEAQRAKIARTAVGSLYRKEDPNRKEDWMVRGTFSR